jgi:hypothetical protein
VTRFLSSLAVDGQVAASTQSQALSVLVFLYRDVLEYTDVLDRGPAGVRSPADRVFAP